ncbi:MAG: aminodeoxychorismate/anthranilate synthase component II [Candidatus Omnitrophica bacterium]|nr:aminodeoxychorismate/anthranilate synthase component II [Candidatus Omnitrophota bacterium]
MVLMIDNYDSFTYNLVQYLGELKAKVCVFRNDCLGLEEIKKLKPEKIVISPGPGRPENAGISCEVIKVFGSEIPVLGVCLGHQAIGYVFGGRIVRARRLMHGKTSLIHHLGTGLYHGLANPFPATRYHSLVVEKKSLPDCLEIEAWSEDGEIMGLRHKHQPIYGVQFHPESILTGEGKKLLKNFLKI